MSALCIFAVSSAPTHLAMAMVPTPLPMVCLRLVLEDQTPTRADVYAVYPQQLHLSARVRSLIDFLVERFKHIDHLGESASEIE